MCGLVGVMGTIGQKEKAAFAELLIIDSIRGMDSTGVAIINKENNVSIIKGAVYAQQVLSNAKYKDALNSPLKVMMGHNRAATKGEINHANAHPFDKQSIVGMHNGTLFSIFNLENDEGFDTDSETIFHTINKKGIKHTWEKLDGAAVLVWWNKSTKTLDFIRNNKRPLTFAITEDGKTMFWASETWMLIQIAKRRNIKLGKLLIPEPNFHFANRISRAGNIIQATKELTAYKYVFQQQQSMIIEPYPRREAYYSDIGWKEATERWKIRFDNKWNNVVPLAIEYKKGNKGVNFYNSLDSLKAKVFYRKYKNCTFCLETLAGQFEETTVIDDHNAACEKCTAIGNLENIDLRTGVL